MRVKAIPEEAIHWIEANPLIVVGGAAVIAGGYFYYRHLSSSSTASVTQDDTATSSDVAGALGYSAPIVYSNGTTATTADSGGSAVSSSQVGMDAASAAILAEQSKEADYNFATAMATLNNQLTLGIATAEVNLAGIQSQNYQIGAGLATAFLQSGSLQASGAFSGPDGANFSFNVEALGTGKKDNSKLQNFLNNQQANLPSNTGTYNAPAANTSYASLLASTIGIPGYGSNDNSGVAASGAGVGASSTSVARSGGTTGGGGSRSPSRLQSV